MGRLSDLRDAVGRETGCRPRPVGPAARPNRRSGSRAVAARQSIERGEPFPSAKCASASETGEATGDPSAPLVRLSAPPDRGRFARPCPSIRTDRKGRCVRKRAGQLRAKRSEAGGGKDLSHTEAHAPQKREVFRREGRRRRSRSDAPAPASTETESGAMGSYLPINSTGDEI